MVDQLACQSAFATGHNPVLGITFSALTRERVVRRILMEHAPKGGGVRLLVTTNIDHISHLARNTRFRSAYAGAWLATADGMPVFLYARLRGSAVPERVTGADLSTALLDRMPPESRPFFVVGSEETGVRLRQALVRRGFAAEAIACTCPEFGFENDPYSSGILASAILNHGTTHLFLGLGAPKSEIWIHEHRRVLGDTYALAVGASLDFYVGLRRRAPIWMRQCGLEWAWRVLSEPKRLFRRYFVDSWYAAWAVGQDLFAIKSAPQSLKPNEDGRYA